MLKLNKKKLLLISGLLIGVVFLATLPLTTQALFKDSKKNIYIGSEEIIEGNFIQAGGIVDFNG